MKITLFLLIILIGFSTYNYSDEAKLNDDEPIVTAQQYIAYKKANGHLGAFESPKSILICYQNSTLKYLLQNHPEFQPDEYFADLYVSKDRNTAILGGWGMGAPSLATKMEQLIVLGVKKFIAVGTAGSFTEDHCLGDFVLSPKALSEDGVGHLYLQNGQRFAEADPVLIRLWNTFVENHALPPFHSTTAWSFPAIFRETPADIKRVQALGCGIVEMESGALYAIGQEKHVQTLSLFVVSDKITLEKWNPQIKEPSIRNNLNKLADWALEFCQCEMVISVSSWDITR